MITVLYKFRTLRGHVLHLSDDIEAATVEEARREVVRRYITRDAVEGVTWAFEDVNLVGAAQAAAEAIASTFTRGIAP